MSVYMGEDGGLLIKRTAVGQGLLRSDLDPGDVSVDRRRFSFDFPVEALITGDRIEIYTADGSNLELVDGHDFPDGLWHCHIDDAGGVRLYDEFEDAINGGIDNALELIEPSATPGDFGADPEQPVSLLRANAVLGDHNQSPAG